MVKHSQSFQNSKFAISLQYLTKEVRDEIDFLHADKHQSLLQIDFNTLGIKYWAKANHQIQEVHLSFYLESLFFFDEKCINCIKIWCKKNDLSIS